MKISELARQSGVPLATIKFYLREGLLPAGEVRGVNQAAYGDVHLRRLALVAQLRDVGGLGIEALKRVTRVLDDEAVSKLDLLGAAVDALGPTVEAPAAEHAQVVDLLGREGWDVRPDAVALNELAAAWVVLRARAREPLPVEALLPYVLAAHQLASHDIGQVTEVLVAGDRATALETVVTGTLLWEPVMIALRRLAHESLTRRLLEGAEG